MLDALNEQINKELFSSYRYPSVAAYFKDKNLPGFAHWMHIQEKEEREHGMKFHDFILERGGKVTFKTIEAPKADWKGNLEAFEKAAAHEAKITTSINAICELALKEKDYPAQVMLQWFISEQVKEEKYAAAIISDLKMIEAHEIAVLQLDHRPGKRSAD